MAAGSWFQDLVVNEMQHVIKTYHLAPHERANTNMLKSVFLEGTPSLVVAHNVREEIVSVLVLPGRIGEMEDLNRLLPALGQAAVEDERVAYGDDKAARRVLRGYARALLSHELAPLMGGDTTVYDSAKAVIRPGPNTPRYLWPDPFVGHPDLDSSRRDDPS